MNATDTRTATVDTARLTAEADQHNAAVIAHSGRCDAFDLCANCRGHKASAIARRHIVRVEAARMGR